MNSNKPTFSKDFLQDLKENSSINNWMRVLNTSGMSAVDRLILDNHRRQILKNLSSNESFPEVSFDQHKSKAYSTSHQFHISKQKLQYRTMNNSFLANENKSECAERLYNDAIVRKIRLEQVQEHKEIKELESALDFANLHHPQRKPDPAVMTRLLNEEKIIKSLYDNVPDLNDASQVKNRRFSCAEQKSSVERLTRARGKSLVKDEIGKSARKLMPNELNEMVKRLYKVKRKDPGEKGKCEVSFDRKNVRNLKKSNRYVEKSIDVGESVVEFVGNRNNLKSTNFEKEFGGNMKSPKCRYGMMHEDQQLEVKLLNYDTYENSTLVSEVIRGSPQSSIEEPCIDNSFVSFTTMNNDKDTVKNDESFDKKYGKLLFSENHDETVYIDPTDLIDPKPLIEASKVLNENRKSFEKNSEFLIEISPIPNEIAKFPDEALKISSENPIVPHKIPDENPNEISNKIPIKPLNLINTVKIPSEPYSKILPIPKSIYLDPESGSPYTKSTNYSQESMYLMQNPLQSLPPSMFSPKLSYKSTLDSYRFIVGITEDDEFIYAE